MSQKTRILVTLAATLVLAAALGAYAYFGVFQKEREELAAKEAEEKLFGLDIKKVTSLTVRAKGETTVLEKRDGSWWVVAPVGSLADAAAVDRLLQDLSEAKRTRVILEDADLSTFGLEEPSVRVEAKTEDGQTAYVAVGNQNTFDSSYFVSNAPRKVFAGTSWLKSSLEKTSFDLRDKRLAILSRDALERVRIEGNRYLVELARQDGKWKMLAPKENNTDEREVDNLLRKIVDLKAIAFPDKNNVKLGNPELTVKVGVRDGEERTIQLWKVDDKVYAQANGGFFAEVQKTVLDELRKNPGDLRDRRIAPFETTKVARMVVRSGEERFVLARTDDGWAIREPKEAPAKRWKVNAGLSNLSELKALETLPASAAAAHGLDNPTRTVELYDAEGKAVATYHLSDDDAGNTYVRIEGLDGVFKVTTSHLLNVPKTLSDVEEAKDS